MDYSDHFNKNILFKWPYINKEWIEKIIINPYKIEKQEDGNLRMWGYVEEINKYFRVITTPA